LKRDGMWRGGEWGTGTPRAYLVIGVELEF
jgi:hypothetical protein